MARGLTATPEEMAAKGWHFAAFAHSDGSCVSTHNGDTGEYDAIAFAVEYSTDCRIVDLRKLPTFKLNT